MRTIGTQLFRMNSFRIAFAVLGFTVGISLAASARFGVVPAIRSSKFDANGLLARASGRGSTGRRDAGSLLIVSEVGLATMLLIGAVAHEQQFPFGVRAAQLSDVVKNVFAHEDSEIQAHRIVSNP